IYARYRPQHNCGIVREDWWWTDHVLHSRLSPTPRALVWTPADAAEAEGYLLFRQGWVDAATRDRPLISPTAQRLEIIELLATTTRAYRALVGWIAANDLA